MKLTVQIEVYSVVNQHNTEHNSVVVNGVLLF